jgi:glycosyltransferase involved in cell wall biosynthesis
MRERLTVAINAQIAVDFPGGTESNLFSLIKAIGETDTEERFLLIGHRKRSDDLTPFMGPNQTLMAWPFDQVWRPSPFTFRVPLGMRARRVQAAAGALGPGVSVAYATYRTVTHLYRLMRYGPPRNPSADQADPVLHAAGVSVLHFPYPLCFGTDLPFVYEPWDLQHRHYPDFFSPQELTWRDHLYRDACRRARLVVTSTRWVKHDIVKQYHLHPTKVAFIPRGSLLAREPLSPAERARTWREHGIPEDFAFYPAATFPHKNHVRLLQALARLRDERGITLRLVCCGQLLASHWPKIEAEIVRSRLQTQVIFLGVVPDRMLASLFQSARFMVFPSLFEGLGLPLLEAMRHGLPIVASDATCIPEVAANGAMLFDGGSVDAIVEALSEAVKNPDALEQIRSRGPAVLSRFSWGKAAKSFVACYRSVAGLALSEEQQHLLAEATEA